MWHILAIAVLAGLACYAAAVTLALLTVRRSSLEQRLVGKGRGERSQWLADNIESSRRGAALVRTTLRVALVMMITWTVAQARGTTAALTTGDLMIAGVLSVVVLWLFTSVLAGALARDVSVGLVSGASGWLRGVAILCTPIQRALWIVDEAVRRLSGANLRPPEEAAEAELLRSIDDTQRVGGLDEASATLLENVVEFSSTDVAEVMTPRTDIDGIELTDDLSEIRAFIKEVGHSRIPVFEENLDHIVGILYVKDLVPYLGEDASGFKLRPILRQPIVVPESKPVRELLTDFQRSEVHMAMVIDEYGGTAGIVTIEDVLEEIVGEIHDEHDADDGVEEASLQVMDDGRVEVDGRFHIDDLNEQCGLSLPEDDEFDTIAGFVLSHMGRVPEEGESFEAFDVRFTAIRATATHVQRIEVCRLAAADS